MIVGDDMGKNTKKKKNAGSTAAYRKADMEARKLAGIINTTQNILPLPMIRKEKRVHSRDCR